MSDLRRKRGSQNCTQSNSIKGITADYRRGVVRMIVIIGSEHWW